MLHYRCVNLVDAEFLHALMGFQWAAAFGARAAIEFVEYHGFSRVIVVGPTWIGRAKHRYRWHLKRRSKMTRAAIGGSVAKLWAAG